jgi:DinB superfamily
MSDARPPFAPADLVASLRRIAGELASLVAELPAGEVTPSPGADWSAAEVVAHLAQFEVLAGARIRMVLTLDRPPLATFDQEEFNRRFADLLSLDAALALFQVNRGVNCDLLDRLVAADWGRLGVHPVRGDETLARSMEMLIRHDCEHLDQLRRAATSQ